MEIPTGLWIAALVFLALTLIPYVLGPILIYLTMRQSAKPQLGTFPVDDAELPKPVSSYFRKVRTALAPAGFEPVAGLTLPDQTPRVKAVCLMFANRRDKLAALASAVYAEDEDGNYRLQLSYLEFATRYRDGSAVQTNNSTEIGAFAPVEHVTTTQLPMVQEPERLYRLHRALCEKFGRPGTEVMRLDNEFKGDAEAYLGRAVVEELEGQVETGYLYESDDGESFRPTLKGAALMTYGLLWPFKAIRVARRNRKAQALLAELEGKS